MTTTSSAHRRNGHPAHLDSELITMVVSLPSGGEHPDDTPLADPVLAALAGLGATAPPGLDDRVFARWTTAPSRLGDVRVAFTAEGTQFVRPVTGPDAAFAAEYRRRFARPLRPADRLPAGVGPSLRGRPGARPDLDLAAGSAFERDVLAATRRIPAGQVRPYAWVAREAGHPAAVRAVGTVLARNPLPLLVPCHRVIRSDGALGNYMFGPERKAELLVAEGADLDELAGFARAGVHYLASDTTGIVCFPTCRDARRITPAHRHGFTTLEAARRAGYRPCRTCRPAAA